MDSTIQINIRACILMNFTQKNMLECKIGCLGSQRGRLPCATQQMTNDGRSFALPITVKKYVLKSFCSAEFLFPIVGKSLL